MKLYLVQHGEAATAEENPKRPLNEKGRQNVIKTARFLKTADSKIDIIWHSPKTRAIETAQLFKEMCGLKAGTEEKNGLSPHDSVEPILKEAVAGNKNLMLVGHLPFLSKLASLALANSLRYPVVSFKNAGVVCLEYQEKGTWQLIFSITPELIE